MRKPRQESYTREAKRVLKNRRRLLNLLVIAGQKLLRDREALREVFEDIRLLIRMLRKWLRKEYRRIPWRTLVAMVAALLYFVNPFDLIPDTLLMMGYIDDIAVMNYVTRAIRKDIERFKAWEAAQLEEKAPSENRKHLAKRNLLSKKKR